MLYTIVRRSPTRMSHGGKIGVDRFPDLKALHGLSKARSLRPVTPVNVEFRPDPVAADELLYTLQPVRSKRHPWGTDFDNLCEPRDDIAVCERLRGVNWSPKAVRERNLHLPDHRPGSMVRQSAIPAWPALRGGAQSMRPCWPR